MTTMIVRPVAVADAGPAPSAQSSTRGWRLKYRRTWSAVLSGLLVIVLWALLAPPFLGGSTSYALVSGISMLPHYHSGDLVLLRRESSYQVGEVAGYHNGQLKAVVMHRIVAIEGGHYFFEGDNNDYVDSFHPTRAQIVGAEWIHAPAAGRIVNDLRIPAVSAILLALLWIFSFRSRPANRRRRRHRHAR